MTTLLTLTEDSWRALASSSPWRWRTLHFTRSDLQAEAWIRRPGLMVVREDGGEPHDHSVRRYSRGPEIGSKIPTDDPHRGTGSSLGDATPPRRPDGLVTGRPPHWPENASDLGPYIAQADPLFQDYTWVAMLDPLELASETTIRDLEDGELRSRRTWWATVSAMDGYEPHCTCCPLILDQVMDRYITEEEMRQPFVPRPEGYPDGFRVGLDVQTGIVASISPVGQPNAFPQFEVIIHEVDGPVDVIDQVLERDRSRVQPRQSRREMPYPGKSGEPGWSAYPL